MKRNGVRFDDLYGHSLCPLSRTNTINDSYLVIAHRYVYSRESTMVLLSSSSSTTLYLLSNFAAAWFYKISDTYVDLHNLRSIVKLVIKWPKADIVSVSTKHINALSCGSEKQSKVMHQQAENYIQPIGNLKTWQTIAERCAPVCDFIFLICR